MGAVDLANDAIGKLEEAFDNAKGWFDQIKDEHLPAIKAEVSKLAEAAEKDVPPLVSAIEAAGIDVPESLVPLLVDLAGRLVTFANGGATVVPAAPAQAQQVAS